MAGRTRYRIDLDNNNLIGNMEKDFEFQVEKTVEGRCYSLTNSKLLNTSMVANSKKLSAQM